VAETYLKLALGVIGIRVENVDYLLIAETVKFVLGTVILGFSASIAAKKKNNTSKILCCYVS